MMPMVEYSGNTIKSYKMAWIRKVMVITIIPVNTHNTDCGFSLPFQASPI
jgi:hypothetical protein